MSDTIHKPRVLIDLEPETSGKIIAFKSRIPLPGPDQHLFGSVLDRRRRRVDFDDGGYNDTYIRRSRWQPTDDPTKSDNPHYHRAFFHIYTRIGNTTYATRKPAPEDFVHKVLRTQGFSLTGAT
jgi:hypothetical protein